LFIEAGVAIFDFRDQPALNQAGDKGPYAAFFTSAACLTLVSRKKSGT
jgi:hypothetical protein